MVRRSLTTASLLVLSLFTVGCDLIAPCDLSDRDLDENALDRRWQIAAVNGAPIPTTGVKIPGSNDRLVFGELNFQTTERLGNCEGEWNNPRAINEDKGRVVAIYKIVSSAGVAKPTKTYAGTFEYYHAKREVTLKSETKSIVGTRVVNDLSFYASIPLLGDYTVVFQKVN